MTRSLVGNYWRGLWITVVTSREVGWSSYYRASSQSGINFQLGDFSIWTKLFSGDQEKHKSIQKSKCAGHVTKQHSWIEQEQRSSSLEQAASRSKEYCAVCRLQSDMVTVHYCEVRLDHLAVPVGVGVMSHGHGWCLGALGETRNPIILSGCWEYGDHKSLSLRGLAKSGEQALTQSKCVMIYQVQQVWR